MGENYRRVLSGDAENEMLGPSGPPLAYVSVNALFGKVKRWLVTGKGGNPFVIFR